MYREVREKAGARHTGGIFFKSDGAMHQAQHAREAGDATGGGEGRAAQRGAPGGTADGGKEALRRKTAAFLKKGLAKNFQKVGALGAR